MLQTSKELQLGKAGEYLVCADLILKGFVAYPSEQGLPYDVVLDTGKKLIRVQVKTTEKTRAIPQRNKRTEAYIFNIKRRGKGNKSLYADGTVDIFALVCLDSKQIAYVKDKEMKGTVVMRSDQMRGQYHDETGIRIYEQVKQMQMQGMSVNEMSEKLAMKPMAVYRYTQKKYSPFKTSSKYVSDFGRDKNWFYEI